MTFLMPPESPDAAPARKDMAALAHQAVGALDEILTSRQLVFVTGKGGVGKSVVAAALALRAVELGLRPLLFECDAPARPSLFPRGIPVGRELGEVAPGVTAINQDAEAAIRAYAMDAVPSQTVAELLLDNRVSRLFLQASPSVSEMALIGRIVHHAERHHLEGPVIVDLHATGHALHVLRAPDGIMRVLRTGPVYERAKEVRDVIFDPLRSVVLTVALAEELPVTELLEFHQRLDELSAPLGPVFVNGLLVDPTTGIDGPLLESLRQNEGRVGDAADDAWALRVWAQRAERERARLVEGVAHRKDAARHVIPLPHIVAPGADETRASIIAEQLGIWSKAKGAPA